MGLDVFFAGMPEQYGGGINGALSAVGFRYEQKETDARIVYGEIGGSVLKGMISSAIAYAENGTNLIFDDMILDERHAKIWEEALKGVESMTVQLNASVDVLISRNQQRGNPPGLTFNHIESNKTVPADLSLDSGVMTIGSCVLEVLEHLARSNHVQEEY